MTAPNRLVRAAMLCLILTGATLSACGGTDEAAPYVGYQRLPIPNVGEHTLPTSTGDNFDFKASDGKLLLVYFGYTSCPDICPTTLSDLSVALGELEGDAADVEVAMVTIDPEVDTPEVLEGYVQSFIPTAVAVHASAESQLRPVATAFGADYGKDQELEAQGRDGVFHTTALYAVDSAGDLILSWSFGTTSEAFASDIGRLLAEEV